MRRGLLALLAVLAGLLMATTAVYAAGSSKDYPPKMHAATESTYQGARMAAMEWRWWNADADRWYTDRYLLEPTDAGWPAARRVGPQEVIELIVDSPAKPDKVFLKSYRNPELTGKAKVLGPAWFPIKRDGKIVGWDILFHLERPHSQHYVTAFVKWDQTPRRHYSYGWERRQVHFKTR